MARTTPHPLPQHRWPDRPRAGLAVTAVAATLALAAPATATPAAEAHGERAAYLIKAAHSSTDILDRIRAVPGVTDVQEAPAPAGYRTFRMNFEQPRDHTKPKQGTFKQRISLLHKDTARPMVMYTSGYGLSSVTSRSEPTRIVDGNQLNMEYRFFNTSIPPNPDWDKQLTIWQAATDQHRIIKAFKPIYDQNWLTTGGSKGGMTATYHRRFYPRDVTGTIPYVAPNDVVDSDDVYNEFLAGVGNTPQCRDALVAAQRRALGVDRAWFLDRLAQVSAREGLTWTTVGSLEQAFESTIIDYYFAFWQYQPESACAQVPGPGASREQIWDHIDAVAGFTFYADATLALYAAYFYQAAYQLGSPEPYEDHIADLLKFPGTNVAESFAPRSERPIRHDASAMPDIDRWVTSRSREMLYVYGSNDPWSAEPFDCGPQRSAQRRECFRLFVPGGNHGASIAQLPEPQRTFATTRVLEWAGLSGAGVSGLRKEGAHDPWTFIPELDRPAILDRGLRR